MTCNSVLCKSDKKWIKTKMKTPIHFNNKGNEIIAWCPLNIWLCLLLSSHHCCVCCCRWCSLHHICASWINNDNVHQHPEIIFGDKDIHSSLGVAREKVRDLPLNMCAPLSTTIITIISLNVLCIVARSFLQRYQSKWVPKLSMVWPH